MHVVVLDGKLDDLKRVRVAPLSLQLENTTQHAAHQLMPKRGQPPPGAERDMDGIVPAVNGALRMRHRFTHAG